MRIKLFLLSLLAFVGFASCSSEDESPAENIAKNVAGTYSGYIYVKGTAIGEVTVPQQNLKVSANNDGTARIEYSSDMWGKMTISNATVTKNGDNYVVKGDGSITMGAGTSTEEYTCSVNAEIVSANDAVFNFSATKLMGGLNISFKTGEMPQSEAVAGAVAGKYEGKMLMYVMDVLQGKSEVNCWLDSENQGKNVKATISGLSISIESMGMNYSLGDIAMSGLSITKVDDEKYQISGDVNTKVEVNGEEKVLTGTFQGLVTDGDLSYNMTFRIGSMPMDVKGVFYMIK